MKNVWLQRIALLMLTFLAIPIAAHAQKVAIGKYQTKATLEKAFVAAMRAVPLVKFSVRSTDKTQGTIQALRVAAGREYASLFVTVRQEEDNAIIEATFTRNPGFMGGGSPDQWAKQFGVELKSDLPDVAVDVKKR